MDTKKEEKAGPGGGQVDAVVMTSPINSRYYNPLENPRRYPLELTNSLHICLWSGDGKFKWTVAYFIADREGYNLHFVGDRPLDSRVDWQHFRELIILGQEIADKRFEPNES